MKADEWFRVKIVEDMTTSKLKVGDKFLTGSNVIGQKENKKIGDQITYFEVISINNNNVRYIMKIEILKEVKR